MGCGKSKRFAELDENAGGPAQQTHATQRMRRNTSAELHHVRRRFSLEARSLPPRPRREVRLPYQLSPEEKSNMNILFGLFDTDNSGKVTAAELRSGLERMGLGDSVRATAEACEQVVRELDIQRVRSKGEADGALDFKEFVRGVLREDSRLCKLLYPGAEQPQMHAQTQNQLVARDRVAA